MTQGRDATDEETWLGASWSAWGCASVIGALLILALAIVTGVYGMFATPRAFGLGGLLRPDPELLPPLQPPPQRDKLLGVPPVGVVEFTTGHELRLADGIYFVVSRTAFDWSPPPPERPVREHTYVEVRLRNETAEPVELRDDQFRMETRWEWEDPYFPEDVPTLPNRLVRRSVAPGETAVAAMVFTRPTVRQVRRVLVYRAPVRDGEVRVMLIP